MPLSLESAYAKCERLANSHYENFPVAKMVPKRLRKHVAAVYAFARTADDIADEEHESIAEDDPRESSGSRNLRRSSTYPTPPDSTRAGTGFSPPAPTP